MAVPPGSNKTGSRLYADFGAHALLQERTELALIVDLDQLLRPVGRVGDIQLHLDGILKWPRGQDDRSSEAAG